MTRPGFCYRVTIISEDGKDIVKDCFSTKEAAAFLKRSKQCIHYWSQGIIGEHTKKKYKVEKMQKKYIPYLEPIQDNCV